MKRFLILAAALGLAACGGGSEKPAASSSSDTVAVKSIDGVGKVLVDSSGQALYSSDVEADGKIKCVDACESFWKPLTIGSGAPTGSSDVGKLGVITRPDGSRQVTVDGKPVYTFSEDGTGEVKGNGFTDDFQGRHFTWSAVLEGGKPASGSDTDASGDGYGY